MKITKLFIQNVKRIKVVEITPKDNVITLTGKNKQGKTSILDSIVYMLGGKNLIGDKPVREGEETAIVKARIGDRTEEFEVSRRWIPSGNSILKVRPKDATSPTDPQTFIDIRIGEIAFKPSEFINEDDAVKVEKIKKMLGLDFTALDEKYKRYYSDRRDVSRDLLKVKKESESYENLEKMQEMRSVSEIQDEYDKVTSQNFQINQMEYTLDALKKQNITLIGEMRKKEDQKLINIQKISEIKEKMKKVNKIDVTLIKKALVKAEENSALAYRWKRKKELATQKNNIQTNVDNLNKKLQNIDKKKKEMVDQINIPIKGLDISADGITYKGISLVETSHAEQLEIAIALLLAENPKIKLILIKHGDKFDDETMKKIHSLAQRRNLQIWMECIHTDDENAIYIEDGMVKGEE